MKRRLALTGVVSMAILAMLYSVDWLQFRIRGKGALGNTPVRIVYAVQHKDGRTEFLIRPPEIETCAKSVFFHEGYTPCWYLQRHPERRVTI